MIDSAAPLGVLKPVKLDPATATLTVRPEDAFNLALVVTGSLLPDNMGGGA